MNVISMNKRLRNISLNKRDSLTLLSTLKSRVMKELDCGISSAKALTGTKLIFFPQWEFLDEWISISDLCIAYHMCH